MLGRKERGQLELFITGSLRQLIPDDHILARVDRVLDLSWLPDEVAGLYCADNGRPGIDPEVAVRLMLAGLLLGIVHDRKLMREAQVNLAIRWFIGYGLHEELPDHSSLTRIRQRWGAERFRRIFERTVKACIDARIASGEIVHVDASLIRADVSWESLAKRHVEAVGRANDDDEELQKKGRQTGRYKKVCVTDPDATMATNARNRRLEPAYKQHAVVDDVRGVVLDVEVTTGEVNEGQVVLERIDAAAAITGRADPHGDRRCRLCLWQGLWRARAARHRSAHSGQGRADPEPGAAAALPLRCPARHRQVPTRQGAATGQADPAWPLLLFEGTRLHALLDGVAVPVEGTGQQGGGDQRRASGALAGPPAT